MAASPKNSALLIIDVQKGFEEPVWGRRNNPLAEERMSGLLWAWRRAGLSIFHVQHLSRNPQSPLRPGQAGSEFKEIVRPLDGETVVQKQVNSAFIGTDLEERLRREGSESLVIVGLTTPHCVSTTARMAGNLGFETYVVSDATAAFELKGPDGRLYGAEELHLLSLVALQGEFAEVLKADEVLERFDLGSV